MDLKTLRLASLQLSPERLDAFVTYERTMLAELASAGGNDWSGRYAFAHAKALSASKLDLVEYGKLKALVADFCGRRSTFLQVKTRIDSGALTGEKLARAKAELPKLGDVSEFEARYGVDAVKLLQSREAELVQLHRDLAAKEGGGHVHPV